MDIVDINKVLDDLELNEEQHSKLSKSLTNNDNSTAKQQQQPDLYSSYKYGQTTSGPPPAAAAVSVMAATATSSPMANVPPRITKTNFVKVSNVFNR